MPFTFTELELPGIVLVEPRVFGDSRGFFKEQFKASDFVQAGLPDQFAQDNFSRSARGVVRGLHFQSPPMAQGKLVSCPKGRVRDIVVDLRRGSEHYGRWLGVELSEDNHRLLWVPPGFGHGFATLSEMAEVSYKCTREYSPEHDGGVFWNDPELAVDWGVDDPVISEKDAGLPRLADFHSPFSL